MLAPTGYPTGVTRKITIIIIKFKKISCGALLIRVMPCSLRVILHKKRFSTLQ
jgi:hypothetical protein